MNYLSQQFHSHLASHQNTFLLDCKSDKKPSLEDALHLQRIYAKKRKVTRVDMAGWLPRNQPSKRLKHINSTTREIRHGSSNQHPDEAKWKNRPTVIKKNKNSQDKRTRDTSKFHLYWDSPPEFFLFTVHLHGLTGTTWIIYSQFFVQ